MELQFLALNVGTQCMKEIHSLLMVNLGEISFPKETICCPSGYFKEMGWLFFCVSSPFLNTRITGWLHCYWETSDCGLDSLYNESTVSGTTIRHSASFGLVVCCLKRNTCLSYCHLFINSAFHSVPHHSCRIHRVSLGFRGNPMADFPMTCGDLYINVDGLPFASWKF